MWKSPESFPTNDFLFPQLSHKRLGLPRFFTRPPLQVPISAAHIINDRLTTFNGLPETKQGEPCALGYMIKSVIIRA